MALFISEWRPTKGWSDNYEWHLSEPLPEIGNANVRFQADGDELELILSVLRGQGQLPKGAKTRN